ncbi:MAG TPA: response regulator transcription factor [Dehalococcoidia bacterium]|nr:response regulator transcription factor [Dehalococcoidia bacterium]
MDRVLVIDREEGLWEIVNGLRELGLQVDAEADSERGFRRVRDEPRLIVVLSECTSPVASTAELVALREITESPILMMGNGDETALVEALMSGADVYLKRPIRIRELAARVRSLSRRYGQDVESENYLNLVGQAAQLDQAFDKLSVTEAKLLNYLLERAGKLTAREDLMASVWGENGKETSLRFYIWQLRRKLAGVGQIQIMNMKGMGYLLKVHDFV